MSLDPHCNVMSGKSFPMLEAQITHYSPAEYRVTVIILDIANCKSFRPVRNDVLAEKPKHFMKIKFLSKAVNAINLPSTPTLLHLHCHKDLFHD